jgi:hypothetical protein
MEYSNFITRIVVSLRKNRAIISGSYFEYSLVFLFFTLLTIAYTNFIAFDISSRLFLSGASDGTAGFLWYNFADRNPSFMLGLTNIVNYPYGEVMGSATFVTYAALWLPLRILSLTLGPVVGLNIMMILGFVSAAIGSYWLLKRLTDSISIGLFAGFTTAFVPYNIYKSSEHLPYIYCVVFAVVLAAFIAVWLRPSKTRAMFFGLAIALAFYTDGYYVLLASVMVVGLLGAGVLYALIKKFKWADYWLRIKLLSISFACLLVALAPVAYVHFTQNDQINNTLSSSRNNYEDEIRTYRSNVVDFLLPPIGNPILSQIDTSSEMTNTKNLRSNPSESTNYIGYIVAVLVIVGGILLIAWVFNRKHSVLSKLDEKVCEKYVLIGIATITTSICFFAFMFSPEVSVLGYTIPLPGKLFIDYDIELWRVMSRFFVPLHVMLTIFASFTLWVIIKRYILLRQVGKFKTCILTAITLLLTLLVAVEYYTSVHRPSFDFDDMPQAYHWLQKQQDIDVVAEFPLVDPLSRNTTYYVTAQIVHGKKLINVKEARDRVISNTLGTINNPEAVDLAYIRGAQAIITHDRACEMVSWGVLRFHDVAADICIYSIAKPASKDKVFARYKDGYSYSLTGESDAKVRITKGVSKITFSGASFENNLRGQGRIFGRIAPLRKTDLSGSWSIMQSGKIVANGRIDMSSSEIDAIVDLQDDAQLTITLSNGAPYIADDLMLANIITTSISQDQ